MHFFALIFIVFLVFSKGVLGSKTLDMTSEGFEDMFDGNFADTWANKFPLILMAGRVTGKAYERGPPSA